MKVLKLIAFLCLTSFVGGKAMAMGQGIYGQGDVEVSKSFTVKGVDPQTGRSSGEKLTLLPGKFKMSLSTSRQEYFRGACPLFIGCIGKRVEVQSMSITVGSGERSKSIQFIAPLVSLNDETSASYAKDSKQSFNVFMKRSRKERKENYREEVEECSVKVTCEDGYYGRCTYAMGENKVTYHDEVTTTFMTVKITGLKNELLATFKASDENSRTVKDGETKCVLNLSR